MHVHQHLIHSTVDVHQPTVHNLYMDLITFWINLPVILRVYDMATAHNKHNNILMLSAEYGRII